MYIHTHTHRHTNLCTCIHRYTHKYIKLSRHFPAFTDWITSNCFLPSSCIHTYIHTYMHAYIYIYIYIYIYVYVNLSTVQPSTQAHILAYIHTYIHAVRINISIVQGIFELSHTLPLWTVLYDHLGHISLHTYIHTYMYACDTHKYMYLPLYFHSISH